MTDTQDNKAGGPGGEERELTRQEHRAIRSRWDISEDLRELAIKGSARLMAEALKEKDGRAFRRQVASIAELDRLNLKKMELDKRPDLTAEGGERIIKLPQGGPWDAEQPDKPEEEPTDEG